MVLSMMLKDEDEGAPVLVGLALLGWLYAQLRPSPTRAFLCEVGPRVGLWPCHDARVCLTTPLVPGSHRHCRQHARPMRGRNCLFGSAL